MRNFRCLHHLGLLRIQQYLATHQRAPVVDDDAHRHQHEGQRQHGIEIRHGQAQRLRLPEAVHPEEHEIHRQPGKVQVEGHPEQIGQCLAHLLHHRREKPELKAHPVVCRQFGRHHGTKIRKPHEQMRGQLVPPRDGVAKQQPAGNLRKQQRHEAHQQHGADEFLCLVKHPQDAMPAVLLTGTVVLTGTVMLTGIAALTRVVVLIGTVIMVFHVFRGSSGIATSSRLVGRVMRR